MTPTVYSWLPINQPGLTPMIRLRTDLPPAQCIAEAAPQLLAQPAGKRCAMLWDPTYRVFADFNNVAGLGVTWPNVGWLETWLGDVFNGLKAAGIELDWMIAADEDGVGYWQLDTKLGHSWAACNDWFNRLFASPAYERLPPYIRNRPVWHYHDRGRDYGIDDWDQFAADLKNAAYRQAVTNRVQHYFPGCKVSNYKDSFRRFPTYDAHGWRIPDSGMGTHGSPDLYLFWRASHWTNTQQAMVGNVNQVRTQRLPSAPWVTFNRRFPEHGNVNQNTWQDTAELLQHYMESGGDTLFYWWYGMNAGAEDPGEHEHAAEVFSSLQVRPRVELPEVPFDATSIPHLPPVVPHVCPAVPSKEKIRREFALELHRLGYLTTKELRKLGYPKQPFGALGLLG